MSRDIININSISQLHSILALPKPKHPLISLIDANKVIVRESELNARIVHDFFIISLKDRSCGMEYGRNSFDFDEGVMVFTGPGQVYKPTKIIKEGDIEGWVLLFHPDLIRNTNLGKEINEYTFFNYDVFEALHLSEDEEQLLNTNVANIKTEYEQRIDKHSQRVIVSNLELLLNYSMRFYERQFNTRASQGNDLISKFENELKAYFETEQQLDYGMPTIQYFAEKSHLSTHYFSDLIKKETGRSPKDHINEFIIDKAKNLILGTERSISEIAYDLGFNYPHYFTRLFKSRTGQTPIEYRNLN